ncbi:hypothetical protein I317_01108 [Kwoniella heveanensis CBS 569]|nr:hypothetical protein I317_01108 [Kwoniella heveanensis CBS 569]
MEEALPKDEDREGRLSFWWERSSSSIKPKQLQGESLNMTGRSRLNRLKDVLADRQTYRLAKYDPNNFKLVIVDEAHHAAAQSYLRILHYFNRSVQLPPRVQAFPNPSGDPQMPIIGFCATFSTADNLALSAVFEEVIFHMDPQQLIACGPLSPLIMTVAKTDLDLDGVMLDKDGEYRVDSVASRMVKNQLTEVIVRAYRERAAGGHIAVATNPDKALWKYTITYRNAAQEWAKSQGLKEPPYGDPELVGFADDLRIAIQTGDTSAKEKFGDDLYKQ